MFRTEEEFDSQFNQLIECYEMFGHFPTMDRSNAYSDYLNDEYIFVQNLCSKCYPNYEIFTGHVQNLDKYKKYNEIVQKAIIHYIILDNIEAFDYEKPEDYRRDNCYIHITKLDDLISIFYEMGLASKSRSLYKSLCEHYSPEFVDEIASEIMIKSYDERQQEYRNDFEFSKLMEDNGVKPPVMSEDEIAAKQNLLRDKIKLISDEIDKAKNDYLNTHDNVVKGNINGDIFELMMTYDKYQTDLKLSLKEVNDELANMKNEIENAKKYKELQISLAYTD